ncbi:unnamed protein product [Gadus morhua 'NCC']
MRRHCGGPGGWPGGGPGGDGPGGGGRLGDPAVEVRRRLVFRPTSSSSMEAGWKESLGMKITAQGLTTPPPPPPPPPLIFPEKRTGQQTRDSVERINKVDLSFRRLKGRSDVRQLCVTVQRPTLY